MASPSSGDTASFARRWAETWERAWRDHDIDAIVELYAEDVLVLTHPFRAPNVGRAGLIEYLGETFSTEEHPEPHLGEPIVSGEHAAVEYWATMRDEGRDVTLAGCSVLRFGPDGLVTEARDYWALHHGTLPPWRLRLEQAESPDQD